MENIRNRLKILEISLEEISPENIVEMHKNKNSC
jgi:hypothetical protein